MEHSLVLAADRIVKRFPGVVALKDVSFDLRAGEIHALCGENGAGKSTLIKVLSGIHPHGSYEGELRVADVCSAPASESSSKGVSGEDRLGGPATELRTVLRTLQMNHVKDAERAGIAVIYQELALVEDMTVAENIFLGAEPRRGLLIDWDRVYREALALLKQFGIAIDPAAKVSSLGVGQKQLVEITKALAKQSRILILDEPTAALTGTEVDILLKILRDLRTRGLACIYISHKLDEVFSIADRITVLRDGESVATFATPSTNKADVIRQMVGREINDFFPRVRPSFAPGGGDTDSSIAQSGSTPPSATLLRVRDLCVAPSRGAAPFLRNISFDLYRGEVLGVGGLMGAGRTELLMHLFGAWGHRISGSVECCGRPFTATKPDEAIAAGLVLVSEDRKRYGLILQRSIGFNLSLSSLDGGLIDRAAEFARNDEYFDALRIKATSQEDIVGGLSGGNQQKVVLGKALMTEPQVVFLDEPTRGIDVGAKVEVYELMNKLTAAGQAVVLVSSELPELMGMSDRILMLHAGAVGGLFTRADATPERLLAAAMGRAGRAA